MKRPETRIIEKVLYENLFGANKLLAKEYGAIEVTIQRKGQKRELVDFMSYDPRKDVFKCYEIKVSMQDFHSKAAKSWYGNYNYLVLSRELYVQQSLEKWKNQVPKHVGIIFVNTYRKYEKKEIVKRPVYVEISQEENKLLKNSLLQTLFYQNHTKKLKILIKEKEIMLVEVTYACKMGCTHCLSDCKPDGEHMTLEVFEDVLKFMIKNQIPTWSFSGGEMFEHPDILKMLSLIESYWKTLPIKYPITFATNGRELVRNKKIYHAVSEFLKHCGKRYVMIQVTDDPRFYPDPLTDNEKYWLSKLGVIIDTVPSDQNDKFHCLYPQGRALENYSDEYWNTIAPKCINCILITKQKPEATLKDLVNILLSNGKVCTPVIAPDGSIKIGESALCPKIASIYDSIPEIMEKIRNAKCRACKIPWEKLKETNPIAYLVCENF